MARILVIHTAPSVELRDLSQSSKNCSVHWVPSSRLDDCYRMIALFRAHRGKTCPSLMVTHDIEISALSASPWQSTTLQIPCKLQWTLLTMPWASHLSVWGSWLCLEPGMWCIAWLLIDLDLTSEVSPIKSVHSVFYLSCQLWSSCHRWWPDHTSRLFTCSSN